MEAYPFLQDTGVSHPLRAKAQQLQGLAPLRLPGVCPDRPAKGHRRRLRLAHGEARGPARRAAGGAFGCGPETVACCKGTRENRNPAFLFLQLAVPQS